MNIPMMIANVSSVVRRRMERAVLTVQQANTVTVTVMKSASGAVHHQQERAVLTVRIERTKGKINSNVGRGLSPANSKEG